MGRITTIFFVLFFVSRAVWAQTLGFSISDGRKKVEIPIEVHNNLVVVPVVLNGMLPLKFVVDTGVRTSIITQKMFTDILNLAYSRKYTISGPGGVKLIDAYITNNVSLDLPGVRGRGHALLVLEQDFLELRNYLGTDVHGVLGYELFSRFIVHIDYEKKTMTLMVPSKFKAPRRYHRIPMKVEDTKPYIFTDIKLSDTTILKSKLLVDSGASHGLLLEQTSDSLIVVPSKSVSSILGRGLGGEIMGRVARVKYLELGPFKLDDAIANFPDPNSYMDSIKLGRSFRHGAIGGDVLSRFHVIYNFSKEEIYLRKNAAFKKKFHYNLSGITVKARGARLNVFEITEVKGQSAAWNADVKAGDMIASINGVSAHYLNLNMVNGMLNSKPGKKIVLEIDRKGSRFKLEFILEDLI